MLACVVFGMSLARWERVLLGRMDYTPGWEKALNAIACFGLLAGAVLMATADGPYNAAGERVVGWQTGVFVVSAALLMGLWDRRTRRRWAADDRERAEQERNTRSS